LGGVGPRAWGTEKYPGVIPIRGGTGGWVTNGGRRTMWGGWGGGRGSWGKKFGCYIFVDGNKGSVGGEPPTRVSSGKEKKREKIF